MFSLKPPSPEAAHETVAFGSDVRATDLPVDTVLVRQIQFHLLNSVSRRHAKPEQDIPDHAIERNSRRIRPGADVEAGGHANVAFDVFLRLLRSPPPNAVPLIQAIAS